MFHDFSNHDVHGASQPSSSSNNLSRLGKRGAVDVRQRPFDLAQAPQRPHPTSEQFRRQGPAPKREKGDDPVSMSSESGPLIFAEQGPLTEKGPAGSASRGETGPGCAAGRARLPMMSSKDSKRHGVRIEEPIRQPGEVPGPGVQRTE